MAEGVSDSSKLQIQKQITTEKCSATYRNRVFPIVQSYKFKSKSQPRLREGFCLIWCFRQFKVTNSSLNHNPPYAIHQRVAGVSDSSKLQIQKQITTRSSSIRSRVGVFPIVQSYKFKSKSQPPRREMRAVEGCFRQFKVTNSKANHNSGAWSIRRCCGVSDSSKLQIQKQITTYSGDGYLVYPVFPIVQSYKFKSKSQPKKHLCSRGTGVSDSSKLQIQKQITTPENLVGVAAEVFPIVQSYKFKSKSQPFNPNSRKYFRCFRQFKVTNSKANHNR